MIVDTSAIVAILRKEPEQATFSSRIARAEIPRISAGNAIEFTAVCIRRNFASMPQIDELFARLRLHIEPVTAEQAAIGRIAYQTYGRGTGHPAGLNFGDCFAYALSKSTGQPLLFKGNDFIHTDIVPAA